MLRTFVEVMCELGPELVFKELVGAIDLHFLVWHADCDIPNLREACTVSAHHYDADASSGRRGNAVPATPLDISQPPLSGRPFVLPTFDSLGATARMPYRRTMDAPMPFLRLLPTGAYNGAFGSSSSARQHHHPWLPHDSSLPSHELGRNSYCSTASYQPATGLPPGHALDVLSIV